MLLGELPASLYSTLVIVGYLGSEGIGSVLMCCRGFVEAFYGSLEMAEASFKLVCCK